MSFDRHIKIAFLGMGLMGSRMATRLLQAGFEVAVWNRTRSACDALIDLGATDLTLQNIADYPVILTCLADDKAALSVYEQIEPFLTAKQVIIDFSSLSVEQTLSLAARAEQNRCNGSTHLFQGELSVRNKVRWSSLLVAMHRRFKTCL